MSRVNRNHRTTPFLGFVLDKGFELRERPAMHAAAGFGALRLIFVRFRMSVRFSSTIVAPGSTDGHDLLTQDMIAVAAEARLLVAHPFQMPFGRLRALLLQRPLEMKQPAFDRLPRPLAQEAIVARDGGPHDAQINANHLIGWRDIWRGNRDDDMQPPAAMPEQQIGGIGRIARIRWRCSRERRTGSSAARRQATSAPFGSPNPLCRYARCSAVGRHPSAAC